MRPEETPPRLIKAPGGYFLAPEGEERVGDVSNVVFANGWVARPNGDVLIYYGASDTRTHVATSTVDRVAGLRAEHARRRDAILGLRGATLPVDRKEPGPDTLNCRREHQALSIQSLIICALRAMVAGEKFRVILESHFQYG